MVVLLLSHLRCPARTYASPTATASPVLAALWPQGVGGQGSGVLMSQRGLMAGRRTWMFSKHTQHFNSRSGSALGLHEEPGRGTR